MSARLAWVGFAVFACAMPAAAQTPAEERLRLRRSPVVEVFQKCRDAVVNISTTQIIEVRSPFGFDGDLSELFDFPVRPRTRQFRATAVGSGFVFHASGYILTNAHVVAQTAERKVIFADKREYDAEIVAADTERDLAVLKIEADRRLPSLRFGRSDDLMVGETVIAIGNPVGLETTVTAGVVSALNRTLEVNQRTAFKGLIQTDASINPGNSGGPLLNVLGELIGINTAIRGDAQNIGFAIPVDQITEALPRLLDLERRYRMILGVEVTGATKAIVSKVEPGKPADQAGLTVGDQILSVADEPIEKGVDFYISMIGRRPGQQVPITLARGARQYRAQLTPLEKPKPDGLVLARAKMGMELEPLPADVARKLGLRNVVGLIVTRVEPNGPAARSRLEPGDILIALGQFQLSTLDRLGLLLEDLAAGEVVRVGLLRVSEQAIYRIAVPLRLR